MDNYDSAVVRFGVNRAYSLVTAMGAVTAVVLAVLSSGQDVVVAVLAAVMLGMATLVAWRLRHRLVATPDGLIVTGLLRSTDISWSDVISITVSRTARAKAATIEIELTGQTLLVMSGFELGAHPREVAAQLRTYADGRSGSES